jgi:phage gpG-like protein
MFTIVIASKGLKEMPERLKRYRIGVLARVTRMLELSGQQVLTRSTEDYLSGPRPKKLGRVSGDLARSVNYRIKGNRVTIGSNLIYARTHEYGATIRPKRAKALVFKLLDGNWASAHSVTIPARPFLRPALRDARPAVVNIVKRLSNEALREAFS